MKTAKEIFLNQFKNIYKYDIEETEDKIVIWDNDDLKFYTFVFDINGNLKDMY